MAAAISASEHGDSVILLEKGNRLGQKLSATGNGRCNLMNIGEPVYYGHKAFAEKVLQYCGVREQTVFWKRYGLFLQVEKEGRVYPCTFMAASVLNALKNALSLHNVQVQLSSCVTQLQKTGRRFRVQTADCGYTADRLILSTGGASQPRLGGSSLGYQLIASFGHHIQPLRPALCPILAGPKEISGLQGIRSRCRVSVVRDQKTVYEQAGEVLFTEDGISGICVMQCARWIEGEGNRIDLDFSENLFRGTQDLLDELRRRQRIFGNLSPEWLLNGILPQKLSYAVCRQAGIRFRGETIRSLLESQLKAVAETFFRYHVYVTGIKGFDHAQVTSGGASCDEFDPLTLESRLVEGFHVTGEALDIDGDCGGFNLMFAFGSGILAGADGRSIMNPIGEGTER